MKPLFGAVLMALVLSVSGCNTFDSSIKDSVPTDRLSAEQRQQKLLRITNWGLKGRISVRTSDDGANANLVWEQKDATSEVSIFGAFGLGAVRLVQRPQEAVLYRNGEKPLYGNKAEELLLWETGLKIPLHSLGLWLRGLPGEGREIAYDSYGRLRSLFYRDEFDTLWAATFERYRDVSGIQLPVRIRVEGGDYVIKLRADTWDAEESDAPPNSQRLQIPGISS